MYWWESRQTGALTHFGKSGINTSTKKDNFAVSAKIRQCALHHPAILPVLQKCEYTATKSTWKNVYVSNISNTKKLEAIEMAIDDRVDKQMMVNSYAGIVCNKENECITASFNK